MSESAVNPVFLCNQCNKCIAEMEREGGTRCVFQPEDTPPG